jgi:hypothetical protein
MPLLGGLPATGLGLFASELAITITNGEVWRSIGLALLIAGLCLVFGMRLARLVGLLQPSAPAGETLAVGLAVGLMVWAAWWAAIWSGGRSSFTPVALGFAAAIGLAVSRRDRHHWPSGALVPAVDGAQLAPPTALDGTHQSRWSQHVPVLRAALAGGVFIVAIALVYGSTLAPSPRDGVQPVEFTDEAFYSVLGRDIAASRVETTISPAGFSELPGVPAQTWYHWGELWLASAIISIFGAEPLTARYTIVLPIVLLAAAGLTGTLVRRLARTTSRRAFVFGFVCCLFLAPVPTLGPFFSSWAVGLIFGITMYGLGAVAVLLALYGLAAISTRRASWSLASFVGSAVGFIMPAHIVVAVLSVVGVGSVWVVRVGQFIVARDRLPIVPHTWRRTLLASAAAVVATAIWGLLTSHGMGGSASSSDVSSFNIAWRYNVALTYLGAGTLLAIPIGVLLLRSEAPVLAAICIGVTGLVVAGAVAWGWRLSDFSMFHVFFAGIAVFGTPVAATAVWVIIERLRRTLHLRLAFAVAILCGIQLGVGVAHATVRLQQFGPRLHNEPISLSVLEVISQLPMGAKLAYACRPFEEASFADSSLISIDAHTGRRVVPMCFEADVFSTLNGVLPSENVPAAGFSFAPQAALYPNASAAPSSEEVAAFMKQHGIDYIFADSKHPNSLVTDAVLVATSDHGEVLRIP